MPTGQRKRTVSRAAIERFDALVISLIVLVVVAVAVRLALRI